MGGTSSVDLGGIQHHQLPQGDPFDSRVDALDPLS